MRLLSAVFDSALLPMAIAKDFFTLGGVLIDDDKSATRQQIEKIEDDILK